MSEVEILTLNKNQQEDFIKLNQDKLRKLEKKYQ